MTGLRRQPSNLTADGDQAPSADAHGADAAHASQAPGAQPELTGAARHAYAWALVVPLFFGAGLLAYNHGFEQPWGILQMPAVRVAIMLALALTPVGVALFAAYLLRQGARLGEEARLTRYVAEEMASPALMAAALNGRALADVTEGVAAAEAAARAAREQLVALQKSLAEDSHALVQATAQAAETGDRLRRQLGGERVALEALNAQLAGHAQTLEETLARSASAVTDAVELAKAQMAEAEAALAARAASLDAVTSAAADAGRAANEDLARQAIRLEDSAHAVAEQMRHVEEGLNAQRAAMTEASAAVAHEQQARVEEAETQRARLEDALIAARFGAVDIREQSAQAAESVRELLSAAGDQLEALTVEARDRRNVLETETRDALARVDAAGAEHRAALERDLGTLADSMTNVAEVSIRSAELFGETAKQRLDELRSAASSGDEAVTEALDRRLTEARSALDQLAEASFAAARQADAHFESRLNTARRLVDRSAALVDDAGERAAARLEAGAALAKAALADVQGGLEKLDEKLERLPTEARSVSDHLTRDLDALVAAARDAAEETRAIDEAFQERIRRNYEVLSQAVSLMNEAAARKAAEPTAPSPPAAAARAVVEEPSAPAPAPLPPPPAEPAPPAPRLKLTPSAEPVAATDEEFQDLFEQAGGPPVADVDSLELDANEDDAGWTWRGLLNGGGRQAAGR